MASAPRRMPRPRLPACRQCSQKKVKCDSSRPKCVLCTRNGSDCLVLDSVSKEWVSRSYIDELERLEEQLLGREDAPQGAEPTPANPSPERIYTVRSAGGSSSTVARGGGLSFIALLFSDAEWRRSNADLLRSLARAPRSSGPHTEACPLPSAPVVQELFERYLTWTHIQGPCLLRHEVWDLYGRIFSSAGELVSSDHHDLFRAFILCAISSVLPYRNNLHPQHPEGYFLAALNHLGTGFLTRGLESIQDLLLVARFGFYHHIGTSIWDLIRLCGRLCVEQGLYHTDGETGDLLQDQNRRRIFWQFYLIDRYSSTTLDRPFAIDDKAIEVQFPADANDDELVAATPNFNSLDAFRASNIPQRPKEMTVFLFCVRLRQISSRIHIELSRLRQDPSLSQQPHLAVGRICTTLSRLLQELASWRDTAPVIENPRCLFESEDWFVLLHLREKLSLVRRAVDLVPKSEAPPPRHLLTIFLRTALETIQQYSALSKKRAFITHTRGYFHMIFTAGLSVLYCTSVAPNLSHEDLVELTNGLRICETTLAAMSEQLPDSRSYVTVFEALRRHVSRKIHRALGVGDDSKDEGAKTTHLPVIDNPGATYQLQVQSQGGHDTTDRPVYGEQSYPAYQYWDGSSGAVNMALAVGEHGEAVNGSGYDLRGGLQFPGVPGDDLLQWAFMNDETIWNMDTMLGEYVYGDPTNSGFLNGVDY